MAEKFLEQNAGKVRENEALVTSTGATDAGKIIGLDTAGRIDQSMMPIGVGPETKILPCSENITAGDFLSVWDDAGTLKVRKADATAHAKRAWGYAVSTYTSGQNVPMYIESINNSLTGLTLGATYYLSASTAGAITATAPSGSGQIVQVIGVAVSATELAVEMAQPIELA